MDKRSVWGQAYGMSALGVTLLCFALTYLFFGFYRVEYEGLNTAFFSGALTPGQAFRSLYFSGNLGISYFYSLLYEHVPGVEWMSWFEYGYLFLACFMGMHIVGAMLPKRTPFWVGICVQVLVYGLVFADHTVHLLYTRVAYMACGLSLLALVTLFRSPGDIRSRPVLFVGLNLFFAVGMFTRVEAALAAFLLLLCFALFDLGNVRQTLRLFLFPMLAVLSLSAFLAIDIRMAGDREFYKQVEPDIEEQFIARQNRVPLSYMKTRRDSVLYSTAVDMMWSDPKVVSAKYLRGLILPEKLMFTDARQWQRVFRTVGDMFGQYIHLVLLGLFLGVLFFVLRAKNTTRWQKLFLPVFLLSFWVLTLLQTYTDKINERSFLPLLSLFILCLTVGIIKGLQNRTRLVYALLLLGVLVGTYQVYCLKQDANRLRAQQEKYAGYFSQIGQLAQGRYLVVNSTVFDYLFLGNGPFRPYDFSAFRKMYITDGYIIPFLPYYKKYLETECGCDIYAFPSFWKYVLQLDGGAVILTTKQRMQVTDDYLRELYGIQLPLTKGDLPLFPEESDRKDAARIFYLEDN